MLRSLRQSLRWVRFEGAAAGARVPPQESPAWLSCTHCAAPTGIPTRASKAQRCTSPRTVRLVVVLYKKAVNHSVPAPGWFTDPAPGYGLYPAYMHALWRSTPPLMKRVSGSGYRNRAIHYLWE